MNLRLKRKRLKSVAILPTLLTVGNGVCGFASVVEASKNNFETAAWLIFLGMFFDAMDGMAARLTKTPSNFGAQLDSLCDVITFGLAPAFLVYSIILPTHMRLPLGLGPTKTFWLVCAFYAVCAMLRLAKFNVESTLDTESHQSFSGLPSPAAAGMIASTVIFTADLPDYSLVKNLSLFPKSLLYVTLITAVLMISKIKYMHVTSRLLRSHYRFSNLIQLLLICLLVAMKPELCLWTGMMIYVLIGPVMELQYFFETKVLKAPVSNQPQAAAEKPENKNTKD